MRLREAGGAQLALTTAGICLVMILLDDQPHDLLIQSPRHHATTALLAAVIAAAVLLALRPRRARAAVPLAGFWTVLLVQAVAAAWHTPAQLAAYVPVAEASVILLAIAHLSSRSITVETLGAVLIPASSIMLLLFGVVHLISADAVAELIPRAVPFRPRVPLLTGCLQLAAAVAILLPRWRSPAALAVAALFAIYLVVVHVPRLATSPGVLFEWRFALTAVALIGALLVVSDVDAHERDRSEQMNVDHGDDANA